VNSFNYHTRIEINRSIFAKIQERYKFDYPEALSLNSFLCLPSSVESHAVNLQQRTTKFTTYDFSFSCVSVNTLCISRGCVAR